MGIKFGAPRLALPARPALSALPRPAHPDHGGGDPNPEPDCRLPGRHARQRRINHPIPQILAVGPRHARLRPLLDSGFAGCASIGKPLLNQRALNML